MWRRSTVYKSQSLYSGLSDKSCSSEHQCQPVQKGDTFLGTHSAFKSCAVSKNYFILKKHSVRVSVRCFKQFSVTSSPSELSFSGCETRCCSSLQLLLEAKFAKTVKINVHTVSTAGKAIASRFGAGKKSKHIELRSLYMQELVQRGVLTLRKVGT